MTKFFAIILVFSTMVFVGCDEDDNTVSPVNKVPTTPQGVYSVTGDHAVWVYWNGIYETDVHHYVVYRSLQETTGYVAIANVPAEDNPQLHLLIYEYVDNLAQNGVTYWYAIAAVDNAGQESPLSAEDVSDTPRPQGTNTLLPADLAPDDAGFDFSGNDVVAWNSVVADFYVDRVVDTIDFVVYVDVYLNGGWFSDPLSDIQDLGYTDTLTYIDTARTDGWSQLGYVEAIVGHTYLVWTWDDHYAKVRITNISPSGTVYFEWAYQTVAANVELAPPARPQRDNDDALDKRTVTSQLIK